MKKKPKPMTNAERQAKWRENHVEEHRTYMRALMRKRRAKKRRKESGDGDREADGHAT